MRTGGMGVRMRVGASSTSPSGPQSKKRAGSGTLLDAKLFIASLTPRIFCVVDPRRLRLLRRLCLPRSCPPANMSFREFVLPRLGPRGLWQWICPLAVDPAIEDASPSRAPCHRSENHQRSVNSTRLPVASHYDGLRSRTRADPRLVPPKPLQ